MTTDWSSGFTAQIWKKRMCPWSFHFISVNNHTSNCLLWKDLVCKLAVADKLMFSRNYTFLLPYYCYNNICMGFFKCSLNNDCIIHKTFAEYLEDFFCRNNTIIWISKDLKIWKWFTCTSENKLKKLFHQMNFICMNLS